jgi:exopolyphosphatase/guanosine-5'-triphosphate,3'-diphosphate pyrophosphatase
MRITRLGQGVNDSRRLADAAIERTVQALREYRSIADRLGVGYMRVLATSAARDAQNRDSFFDAAENATGVRPELLTGIEEGELTYAGATRDLPSKNYLVVDIGGGSTEFVLGTNGVVAARSVDVGCVRLTEEMLRSDPYAPEELSNAFSIVEEWCTEVSSELPIIVAEPELVGVAGTVTSLAAMDLGLTSYIREKTHHHRLTHDAVEELFRSLSMQSEAQRSQDPLLPPGRSDVLTAGTIILLGIMRHFTVESCLVSESDILDGAAGETQQS